MTLGTGSIFVYESSGDRRKVWCFRELDGKLCFISYCEETRATMRHKWRPDKWHYSVYNKRDSTLKPKDVIFPLWVLSDVVHQWRSRRVYVMDGPGREAKVLLVTPSED
jgi:hypothetical protein